MTKVIKTKKALMDIYEEDFVNFSRRVYVEMSKHIGRKNAVSRMKLFTKFFGPPDKMNFYEVDYLWQRIYSVLNYLRKNTECFVIADRGDKETFYYVIKTSADAKKYIANGNDLIKAIKVMQVRAKKAVSNKWYKNVVKNASKYTKEISYKK